MKDWFSGNYELNNLYDSVRHCRFPKSVVAKIAVKVIIMVMPSLHRHGVSTEHVEDMVRVVLNVVCDIVDREDGRV